MYTELEYEEFQKHMEEKFPKMFNGRYGGFAVGKGWWPIIRKLCSSIQYHIDWKQSTRELLLKDNPRNIEIPEKVDQVVVVQIKEKFGGLRFYYNGGDERVNGMVTMAEAWASMSCEECGAVGHSRSKRGWSRTLCDEHFNELIKD